MNNTFNNRQYNLIIDDIKYEIARTKQNFQNEAFVSLEVYQTERSRIINKKFLNETLKDFVNKFTYCDIINDDGFKFWDELDSMLRNNYLFCIRFNDRYGDHTEAQQYNNLYTELSDSITRVIHDRCIELTEDAQDIKYMSR